MKIIASVALIASSFTPVAFPPLVAAAVANPSNCNACNMPMPSSAGWSCQSSSTTYYSHSELTGDPTNGDFSITCQDYEDTGPSLGINPAGNAVPAFSSAGGTGTPIGGPYPGTDGACNYPIE
jgi:hypothetical protein